MLKVCDISFDFDKQDRIYEIGERVTGRVHLHPTKTLSCNGLALNLFWRTHGRGNRAKGEVSAPQVDFYEAQLGADQTYSVPFAFDAPPGPLTYRGHYLNVDWYLQAILDVPLRPGFLDPKDETEILILPKEGVATDLGPAYSPPMASDLLSANATRRPQIIIGAVFSGFALIFSLPAFLSGGFSFFVLIPAVFFIVGMLMVFGGLRNRLAAQRLGDVAVDFDARELVPGETLGCRVSFTPKTALELERVRLTLSAEEKVVSGSGTNKTTHTHTLFEEKRRLQGTRLEPGTPVTFSEHFTLPLDAPYSFAAKDNEVRWRLNVLIDTKGPLDWSHDYQLAVLPWRSLERDRL